MAVLSKLAEHGPHKGKESVQPYYKPSETPHGYEDYSLAAGMQNRFRRRQYERFADDPEYREWIMHHLIRTRRYWHPGRSHSQCSAP